MIQLQNIPSQTSRCQIIKKNITIYTQSCFICLANYFQCDRNFAPLGILPYQVSLITDQNTLAFKEHLKGTTNHKIPLHDVDSVLIQQSEKSRWAQLSTWDWWKNWLCCPYTQQQNGDQQTQFEKGEQKFTDEEKMVHSKVTKQNFKNKKRYPDSSLTRNDEIILAEDDTFENNQSNQKQSFQSISNISTQFIKVNPHKKLGDVGIRKRKSENKSKLQQNYKKEFQECLVPIKNPISQPLKRNGQNQLTKVQNKASPPYSQYPPLNVSVGKNYHGQSLTQQLYQRDSEIKVQQKPNNIILNSAIYQGESKFNKPVQKRNFEAVSQSSDSQNRTVKQYPNKDDVIKKKRKQMDLFQDLQLADEMHVIEQLPPQDLDKKRRKRRKEVKAYQRQQLDRMQKREKDDLQMVIFDEQ